MQTWPASGPRSCDESVLSPESRVIPAADPFLGFHPPERTPVRPGARFGRGASPLALGRFDVQTRLGLRVLQYERVGRSVSGPPTPLGFSAFRRSRRSVHRFWVRAYCFASRSPSPKATAGDPCSRVTTQQLIPGQLPGTGAIRLAIGDLVRSSVLVFQRAELWGSSLSH